MAEAELVLHLSEGPASIHPSAQVSPLAEQFAATDGLIWKIWALDEENSQFSGLLLFEDAAAMQAFLEGELAATVTSHPALSDFEFCNETWTFAEQAGGTRVRYELHMDPKFWVPPAIGPYLIKRKLRNDGTDALDRIERVARDLSRD